MVREQFDIPLTGSVAFSPQTRSKMATSVEVSTPATRPEINTEDVPKASQANSMKQELPESGTSSSTAQKRVDTEGDKNGSADKKDGPAKANADGDGKGQAAKVDLPKAKIFDNKNFVEAPLPKTNPWKKNTAAPAAATLVGGGAAAPAAAAALPPPPPPAAAAAAATAVVTAPVVVSQAPVVQNAAPQPRTGQ